VRAGHPVVLTLASFVVLGGGVALALLLAPGKGAGHLVAAPTVLDLGRVAYGEVRRTGVRLRNEGPRDVVIGDASANCSCFRIDTHFQHLLHPGDEVEIAIEVVARDVPIAPFRGKRLTVHSDDPNASRIEIALKGDVVEAVKAPRVIELGRISAAELPAPKTISVRGGPGFRARYERFEVHGPDVLDVKAVDAENGKDLTVSIKPGTAGAGSLLADVEVFLEVTGFDDGARKVRVPVKVTGEWAP
jgi:hypothetical protein